MRGKIQTVWAMLFLASCGGNPFTDGGTVDPGTGTPGSLAVPAAVNRNLNSASYTPGASTIRLNLTAQDASALDATYTRNAAYDVAGYQAYTYQASSSNRYVLALVKSTGAVKGLVAADGGQFATYHSGGDFVRISAFSLPASGVAGSYNYAGSYVGLWNVGTPVPGPGGAFDPTRAYRTSGRALVTADFTDMIVSGGVDQHIIVDPLAGGAAPAGEPLPSFELYDNTITSTGTFAGKVYIGGNAVGDYAGLFAGLNAAEIAMLLVFNPVDDAKIFEHGLIVLDNCLVAGGTPCP